MGQGIRDIGSRPKNEVADDARNVRGGNPADVERATETCDGTSVDSLSSGVSDKLTRANEGDKKNDGKLLDYTNF